MPADDKPTDSFFRFFSPTIKFPESLKLPGSGSFGSFNYQPYTKWESPALFRGDEQIEGRIYSEVASPGKQLGKISELVVHLADTVLRLEEKISLLEQKKAKGKESAAESPQQREIHEKAISDLIDKTLDVKEIVDEVDKVKGSNKSQMEKLARKDIMKFAAADKKRCKAVLEEYLREIDKELARESRKKNQAEEA